MEADFLRQKHVPFLFEIFHIVHFVPSVALGH